MLSYLQHEIRREDMNRTKKNTQFVFRLTEDLAKKFRLTCVLKETKMQTFFEKAVEDFVKQVENDKPE